LLSNAGSTPEITPEITAGHLLEEIEAAQKLLAQIAVRILTEAIRESDEKQRSYKSVPSIDQT
jgi:hypothetical protein